MEHNALKSEVSDNPNVKNLSQTLTQLKSEVTSKFEFQEQENAKLNSELSEQKKFAKRLHRRVVELENQNQTYTSQNNTKADPQLADLKSQLDNREKPFYPEYDSDDNKIDKRVKMNDLIQMHDDFKKHNMVNGFKKLQSKVDRVMDKIGGVENLAQLDSADVVRLDTKINKIQYQ